MFEMTVCVNVGPDHNHDFQLPNCINVDPELLINRYLQRPSVAYHLILNFLL